MPNVCFWRVQFVRTTKRWTRHVISSQSKIAICLFYEIAVKCLNNILTRPFPSRKYQSVHRKLQQKGVNWKRLSQIGRQHLYRRITKRGNSIIIKIFPSLQKDEQTLLLLILCRSPSRLCLPTNFKRFLIGWKDEVAKESWGVQCLSKWLRMTSWLLPFGASKDSWDKYFWVATVLNSL